LLSTKPGANHHLTGLECGHGDLVFVHEHDDTHPSVHNAHAQVMELAGSAQRDLSTFGDDVKAHPVVRGYTVGG
jgi:hypothetical protein